ncbi:MAG TPA: 4-hydroxythreonine-4-phosphate dehydrogenase PdxA [Cyanobacteria bacterium UBA10660]|nr:MAG TPA: 4-hydroxythreonine-4-phosphate dehydrogenase PdxA [Candidatus Gastranaerophilales bacterium HUM_1]HAS94735.1 4-hydroxythreonine-4-phosphate dehydrogenase PdxA [Cyanobacteria bacterium UBA10660]
MDKIAITTGDPNGIGAEITIKALNELDLPQDKIVLISNKDVLDYYGKLDKKYDIIEIPFDKRDIKVGKVTKEAGEFSFQSLLKVCEIKPKAIVTAPVAKNAMYLAGHNFNGQTEVLQKYLAHDNQLAEMLFVANNFRVLLLTRHCALKDVYLTKEIIVKKITNLVKTFNNHFNIPNPRFALCGFNPHSGEDGILGREEIDILIPAVKELQALGVDISMPLPADTLFVKAGNHYFKGEKDDYDCYIANYHDQGLIPIKTVAGDKTVNMTIGLDIIRTSPGHGTAFDIAGQNIADPNGMISAIREVL